MELTIGRESGNQRLMITTDNGKTAYYGNVGSVPKSVSRQHCKLQVISPTEFVVTNIKSENKTMVNGLAVMQKHITINDRVELGKDNYLLSLAAIVKAFVGEPGGGGGKTYSISHLEKVWNDYNQAKLDAQIQQSKESAISSVSGLFSMAAILAGFFPGVPMGVRIAIYGVAISLAVYFFYSRVRKASYYPKLYQDIDKKFHDNYVCPNTDCRKFLGYQPFDDLKKTKKCPYCSCMFKK